MVKRGYRQLAADLLVNVFRRVALLQMLLLFSTARRRASFSLERAASTRGSIRARRTFLFATSSVSTVRFVLLGGRGSLVVVARGRTSGRAKPVRDLRRELPPSLLLVLGQSPFGRARVVLAFLGHIGETRTGALFSATSHFATDAATALALFSLGRRFMTREVSRRRGLCKIYIRR